MGKEFTPTSGLLKLELKPEEKGGKWKKRGKKKNLVLGATILSSPRMIFLQNLLSARGGKGKGKERGKRRLVVQIRRLFLCKEQNRKENK